ncbi:MULTISPECIES: helix-turn-helix transcriptional regulator [Acinetobacter]|uniref:Helix-turn-helix transcriptional regulator n=1 Tax=Acinetobacter variabilis TaxID=70346 RepID=A0A427MAR0_9GAMM|nr:MULTISPECIES: helix-turn-helix transcriptional regulator [Acinetobacter]EXA67416.1 helix-turn-helix family protein [Acinetobacter baumannii 348935]NHB64584.1 helix-turn-helix transcriptional regulator [Acinetobacter sp. GFQ9D191M]NHC01079.1 helix-turn-helix transcriptional regulator [Acinetobacter sp. GFQ9D192M]QQN86911.1 helix-turn-helix transcriptional regulator [Acinetobacter variabilis]QXR20627.1 helix-turn-helix transcriptional regulator [Acinetobacter variabilis]
MLKNDIIVFRAKKRWTQQQLADAVAVSRQTIAALEKEKYNPSLILAFKLANALETTIEELFSYAEEVT